MRAFQRLETAGSSVLHTPFSPVTLCCSDEGGRVFVKTRLRICVVYDGGRLFPIALDQEGLEYTTSADDATAIELTPLMALLLLDKLDAIFQFTLGGPLHDEIPEIDREIDSIRERIIGGSEFDYPSKSWVDISLDNYATNTELSFVEVVDEFFSTGKLNQKEVRWMGRVGLLPSSRR